VKGHEFSRGPQQSRFWVAGVVTRAGPEFTRVITVGKEPAFHSAEGLRVAPGVGAERLEGN